MSPISVIISMPFIAGATLARAHPQSQLCARSRTQQAYGMLDSYRSPSGETLRWVEETLGAGAHVAVASRLYGGVTADMDRLTINTNAGHYDAVLRRWPPGEWSAELVDCEAAALTALADHTLPAPRLLGADRSGMESGPPSLLMTALDGELVLDQADFLDCMPQLAQALVRIHDIDPGGFAPTDPHPPDADSARGWIKDRTLAGAVEHAATQASTPSAAVFVHGDYQPFNFLWRDGRLTGIVDWTYAGRGWREIDVGHCRLAIAVLYSPEVAEMFLRLYETETGLPIDPRLDIRAQLHFSPHWFEFVPHWVTAGAHIDTTDVPNRVENLLRLTHARL